MAKGQLRATEVCHYCSLLFILVKTARFTNPETMAEDNFEIRRMPHSGDESFQTIPPDFGALLQRETQNANGMKQASGLLASGVLPELKVAMEGAAHKPNDHVHIPMPGFGQLDLDYDGQGKLSNAHLDYDHGTTEDARFVDGHIVENHKRGQFNSDYTFHTDGTVASESFQLASKTSQYYEFDEKGNVTLAVVSDPDHTTTRLDNEPGNHDIIKTGPNGTRATLNYNDNQQFQNGQIRNDSESWGLRPSKNGEAEVVPETET